MIDHHDGQDCAANHEYRVEHVHPEDTHSPAIVMQVEQVVKHRSTREQHPANSWASSQGGRLWVSSELSDASSDLANNNNRHQPHS